LTLFLVPHYDEPVSASNNPAQRIPGGASRRAPMNPFRRWFGQRPPADPPPTSAVPPDHQVKMYAVPTYVHPSLYPFEGGVCLIHLGYGSDEPVEELTGLMQELEPQLAAPRRPVLLSQEEGPLSRLFAPSHPAHEALPRLLLWVFTRDGLADWLEKPARLQALLRHLHRLRHPTQPFTHCAYVEQDSGPGAAVLARLLAGLGVPVRVAEPAPERLLLAEVHRPDGRVFTALAGHAFPLEGPADTVLATVYRQQAEAQGDAPRLRILEQMERDHLCRELQSLPSEPHRLPPPRAPRLGRLLRTAVEQGGPTARKELERELLERARPLPLLMKPDGDCFIARIPGIGPVLQVFPDLLSLQQAVKEFGLAEGSYRFGGIPARAFFAHGAQQNLLVALNLSLTASTSQDVRWSPAEARLLAQGQYSTPTASPPIPVSPAENGPAPELLRGALTEADGYLEQGLYDKAFEPLRRIFSRHPENLDAHEKAYHIYVAADDTQRALEQCLNVLRLCTRRAEVQRAQPYLTALLLQWPFHPEMPAFLSVLDPDERSFQTGEKTVIGRKSMSLELTAEEQQAAHTADTMMRMLRLMNGDRPYPGLPPGAIPLTELESGASDGEMFRIKRALRVGVDPNEQTVRYGTALHAAAHAGQLDAARLLVDHGADPKLRDGQGRTPSELARLQNHGHVANFLETVEHVSRIGAGN
jgi:hypothetical protein